MIQDLLALAKVNNPDRPLHEVEVDLAALVRDVARLGRAEAAAGDVKVRLDLAAGAAAGRAATRASSRTWSATSSPTRSSTPTPAAR